MSGRERMPRQGAEIKRPKAWRSEVSEEKYDFAPEFRVIFGGCYAKVAEERCVSRYDPSSLYGPKILHVLDGQRGEKVIASGIGPSFANQTEDFKRLVVIPNIIDDGRD